MSTNISSGHSYPLGAELMNLGRDIRDSDNEAAEMGLTDYEYAFYTAVANHENARELMQKRGYVKPSY